MKYRKEIDGLRAVAVLPVILFHAGFTTFSGGFVGVDVFFVISGYLITTIIVDEMEIGSFSLLNFYERRARRILPALFFVMLCTLPFAWYWMLPQDLKSFSQSLVSVSLFASNVLFYLTSGYFDTASEFKPLLHTWSLAVEEQYYVLFPLFLMLAWRLGKKWIISLMLLVSVVSVIAAQWGSETHTAFTFFLLPARVFEILIGALISLYINHKSGISSANQSINKLISLAGLLLILYAIFAFDKRTPSPGLYTLIPTIGAGLVIVFANSNNLVGKILGSKLLVFIGLISYSAYLWHQPLLAFARLISVNEPSITLLGLLAILSIILGYLSWRYIETPFRNKESLSRKRIFVFGALGSLLFISIGLFGNLNNGFYDRFSKDEQVLLAMGGWDYKKTMLVYSLGKCFIDKDQDYQTLINNECISQNKNIKKIIVFGDSEAAHLMGGVLTYFKDINYSIEQWTGTSCRAINYSKNNKRCDIFYNEFMIKVVPSLNENDIVIISSKWIGALEDIGNNEFIQRIDDLFNALKITRTNVVVVGSTPEFSDSPFNLMVKKNLNPNKINNISLISNDFRKVNQLLSEETERYGYIFFDPTDVLCDKNDELMCLVSEHGSFVFYDGRHLSMYGSQKVISNIKSNLEFFGITNH